MKTKIFTTILLLFVLNFGISAQDRPNPFELTPRLNASAGQTDSTLLNAPAGNPFDIEIRPGEKKIEISNPITTRTVPEVAIDHYDSFLFGVTIFNIVLITLLFLAFRSVIDKTYRSLTNDNMLSQVYRERKTGGGGPYFMVYGLFFINAGFFIFLILKKYGIALTESYSYNLLLCIGAVTIAFLFKHLLLALIGYIFPVGKETSLYSFAILIFSIIIGLLLVPANLIISYAPESIVTFTLWIILILIGILYLIRLVRGLFIANRFLIFHKFHFLLYICTVEIAPVLVIIKLIFSELPI